MIYELIKQLNEIANEPFNALDNFKKKAEAEKEVCDGNND